MEGDRRRRTADWYERAEWEGRGYICPLRLFWLCSGSGWGLFVSFVSLSDVV
jgi:hypothetical protein